MLKNVRHEAFAAAYAVCGNAAEAYRQAGYTGKDADSHGARLMGNDSIQARIEEIRKTANAAGSAVLTLIEKRELLAKIARRSEKDSDRISAIKVDNDMTGDNAPVKITGSLTIDQLFPGASFLPESIPASAGKV